MGLLGEVIFVYRYTRLLAGGHLPIDERVNLVLCVLGAWW
jgi:hypothetical protein